MLSIGDKAPDFTLQSNNGSMVTLSDLRGKRVLLFFYPKANTPGCTTQACGFRDNYDFLQEQDIEVYGISPDRPIDNALWRAKERLPFLLLSDEDQAVSTAYGVWGEKSMYGNIYMGIIRSHFFIDPEGIIEEAQVKVSPKKSVEKAMKYLQSQLEEA